MIGIESPAAEFVSNRPPILDVASQPSYDQTREWLQYCDSHHECYAASERSFAPTRVIDVGMADDVPKLIQPHSHSCHYAALSYCWGGDQSVMTERCNVQEFFKQLPISELQQTIKDAILTTRKLGLRFLWIDSLCIIQDSDEDKIQELSTMHEIYANAYVTIVAASAKRCDDGFLQLRHQLPDDRRALNFEAFSIPYRLRGGGFDEVLIQPFQSVRPSLEPINSRAWTLQEILLSPRLLLYGSQLWRECRGRSAAVFGLRRYTCTPISGASNVLQVSKLGFASRTPPLSTSLDIFNHMKLLHSYWSEVVHDYSERQLTNESDKLIAISGIARRLSVTIFKDYSYKAGMWLPGPQNKSYFLLDLCWTANTPLASRQCSYLAPSWSWASGHVQSSSGVRIEDRDSWTGPVNNCQLCSIVDCTIDAEREDPFSRVLGGSLTVRGPLKKACISSTNRDKSSFDIVISGNQMLIPSQYDRLLSFSAANPSETVYLSSACRTRSTLVYDLSFRACFDAIIPELSRNPNSISVWCLQLVRKAGLILQPVDDGVFRRIGTFRLKECDYRDEERIDGCFEKLSVTQVTII
jgi:hypothetical protein